MSAAAPVVLTRGAASAAARRPSLLPNLFGLTRPRILGMVVFTSLPLLRLADGTWPAPGRALAILSGLALLGVACDALNAWIERRSDALMERTRDRPLPAGRLRPGAALAFGLSCGVLAHVLLLVAGGPLAAALAFVTIAYYLLVYTAWLKPRTHLAAVLGAASGAAAPLVASAAADGRVSLLALLLFAVIVVWTAPHTWAIALLRHAEYSAAGLPTLPAVHGEGVTRRAILWSMLPVAAVTLAVPFAPRVGWLTAVISVALGAWLATRAASLVRGGTRNDARRFFRATLCHVAALFAAVLIDVTLAAG